MQVFVPYPNPFGVAQCLDKRRLNKQIVECGQILRAIDDPAAPWSHHPVVAMWKPYRDWLWWYRDCLDNYRRGNLQVARDIGLVCFAKHPAFLTRDFCHQHRRRLYAKDPVYYAEFAEYGISEENWYYVDGKLVRYIKGKKI